MRRLGGLLKKVKRSEDFEEPSKKLKKPCGVFECLECCNE